VLNLAKVAEILFSSSRDSVREGLKGLAYTDVEIEAWFLPALALRSKLDVAHVSMASLSEEQLQVLHEYTEGAIKNYRELMTRLLSKYDLGDYALSPYTDSSHKKDIDKTIGIMKQSMARLR